MRESSQVIKHVYSDASSFCSVDIELMAAVHAASLFSFVLMSEQGAPTQDALNCVTRLTTGVGVAVGLAVGEAVGAAVGLAVGAAVGAVVGVAVGAAV